MSESVSPVDAIIAGLRGKAFQLGTVVELDDAEAAVHATAQKYQAALARQGRMLDQCRDERLSWEDVKQHTEAAVHATVREIEAWLREEFQRFSEDSMATDEDLARRDGLLDAADEVARRFGGTT